VVRAFGDEEGPGPARGHEVEPGLMRLVGGWGRGRESDGRGWKGQEPGPSYPADTSPPFRGPRQSAAERVPLPLPHPTAL
jgi:hypothetical protein